MYELAELDDIENEIYETIKRSLNKALENGRYGKREKFSPHCIKTQIYEKHGNNPLIDACIFSSIKKLINEINSGDINKTEKLFQLAMLQLFLDNIEVIDVGKAYSIADSYTNQYGYS